jgi:hypothetical protein
MKKKETTIEEATYIKWLKERLTPYSTKAVNLWTSRNERRSLAELSGLCNGRRVGEADLPATTFYSDSLEQVMKGWTYDIRELNTKVVIQSTGPNIGT